MNEKHVITQGGDIVAIVENKMLAEYFARFLTPDTRIEPLSNYDFAHDKIREFMK